MSIWIGSPRNLVEIRVLRSISAVLAAATAKLAPGLKLKGRALVKANMAGFGAVLAILLIKWNLDSYILLRIRVLMGFLISLYFVVFVFSGAFLRSTRAPKLSLVDVVSDTLLVYIMGTMQAAPFKNQMFPIWAVLLVGVRSTVTVMSKYNTYFELTNMLKLWAAAFVNVKHGSKSLRAPFWFFWGVLVLKSLYRIRARKLASKSLWHGRNSELVREYMGAVDHNLSNFNPDTLEGCKYLVYGELKKNITDGLSPSINDLKSVVALDAIWMHDGSPLVRTINRHKNTIKDLTLAFALSRLLQCRMEGGRLHEDTISMTNKIICSRIIHTDCEVLTGILKMDLLFLSQHIHTGYPMVFCQGLGSVFFPILQSVLQFTCVCYLLGKIGPDGKADHLITVAVMLIILVMQVSEVRAYISSNWTILLLVFHYVNSRSNNKFTEHVFGRMISSAPIFPQIVTVLCTGPYDLLRSSSYSQGKLRSSSFIIRYAEISSDLSRDDYVVSAVVRALADYMDDEGLPRHRLPTPRVRERTQRYWSAWLELPSCSHVILVWHIATSLCQVKLEQDRGVTNSSAGLFRLLAGNTRVAISDHLIKPYTAASCLSRHCLNLLISRPGELPENVIASKKLLLDTIHHAHDILKGCNSLQGKYDKLMALARQAALSQEDNVPPESAQDIQLRGNILMQGAMMGKELIDTEAEEGRWEILAEVWVHILLQIAPSSKIEAHKKSLQFEAPLVTIVWAVLCHCGIEKSELWPEER